MRGADDTLNLRAANEMLGGDFLSRINMDLRETKGWSYGARSSVDLLEDRSALLFTAPVQADKTGPAIQAVMDQIRGFLTSKGLTASDVVAAIRERLPAFDIAYEPDFRQEIAHSWPGSVDDRIARRDWGWEERFSLSDIVDHMLKHVGAGRFQATSATVA